MNLKTMTGLLLLVFLSYIAVGVIGFRYGRDSGSLLQVGYSLHVNVLVAHLLESGDIEKAKRAVEDLIDFGLVQTLSNHNRFIPLFGEARNVMHSGQEKAIKYRDSTEFQPYLAQLIDGPLKKAYLEAKEEEMGVKEAE